MFSTIKSSIFPVAATAVFLSLYATYFPAYVNIAFLVVAVLLLVLGLISFALAPKQFIPSIGATDEMLGLSFLPLSLVLITYRLSQNSFLTKPYEPFFIAFSLFFTLVFLVALVIGGGNGVRPRYLYPAYALSSLSAIILYLLPIFSIQGLEFLFLTLYIIVNAILFILAVGSLPFAKNTFLYTKAYLCYVFPSSLLIIQRFGGLTEKAPVLFLFSLLLVLSCLLVFFLFMFEKKTQVELKKANLSAFLGQALWTYAIVKNDLVSQSWFLDMKENVWGALPQFMLWLEYLLLFLCFMVFTKAVTDQLMPSRRLQQANAPVSKKKNLHF